MIKPSVHRHMLDLIYTCLLAVLVSGCSQYVSPPVQPTYPVGDAWDKLTLYEKEQVVERYERSKRAPLRQASSWSFSDDEPDLFVSISVADTFAKPLKTGHYSMLLRHGDCYTVTAARPTSGRTHKRIPLMVCWRHQQLSVANPDKLDDAQAVMRIHPHPLWSFGLSYPRLFLGGASTGISVYVQSLKHGQRV